MEKVTMTVFKATDGTQFDTEEECLEYEGNNLPSSEGLNGLMLFDEKTLLISFKHDLTYSYLYDKMQFFVIVNKTEESLACLRNILAQGPYDCPDPIEEGRIYAWSGRDGWYDYSEKFCQMKETVDIIIDSIEFRKQLLAQTKENT